MLRFARAPRIRNTLTAIAYNDKPTVDGDSRPTLNTCIPTVTTGSEFAR